MIPPPGGVHSIRIKMKNIKTTSNKNRNSTRTGSGCAIFELDEDRFGLMASTLQLPEPGPAGKRDLGFRAMMNCISIITAHGGAPKCALVSPAKLPDAESGTAPEILQGAEEAAGMAGVDITCSGTAEAAAAIHIALYGEVSRKRIIRDSGAKPGEIIYLTGCTGDSLAGSEVLFAGGQGMPVRFPGLTQKYKRPVARYDIIKEIILLFSPTSMTHVARGIIPDLGALCAAGGFTVNEESLPLSRELREFAGRLKKNPVDYALYSGNEFELLFTSPKDLTETMNLTVNKVPVTPIGMVTGKGYYLMKNGRKIRIDTAGR